MYSKDQQALERLDIYFKIFGFFSLGEAIIYW